MKLRPLLLALTILFVSAHVPLPVHAVTLTSDLSIGSRGAEVTQLQLTLFQFGYSTAAPNGVYSETTAAGVRALQKKYGLPETGTLGAQTRAILNPFIARNPTTSAARPSVAPVISSVPSVSATAPLAVGARGTAVLELQQKLLVLGFFGDTPTGYFGPITRAAVMAFQAAKGLEQVGFVGPRTRALLATVSTTAPTATDSTSADAARVASALSEDSPTLSFRSSKRSAPAGDTIRLTWSAKNATTCTAGNGWSGEKAVSGSETLTFSADSTYALVCTGSGGSISKSVSVEVSATVVEPEEEIEAPTLTFSADKSVVDAGGSVKLSWRSSDADSCTATGDWTGQKDKRDTETISGIVAAKTFTLSCVGAGGSITRSVPVTLEVVAPTPTPTPTPLPTPLPGPSKSYEVYAGCEAPAQSYVRVIYIDPKGGSDTGDGSAIAPLRTLQAAFSAKKLRAGDHIVLMPGRHGSITADAEFAQKGYFNADAANWTWFDFQEGAEVGRLELRDFSRVLITNPEVTPQGIMLSGGKQFIVADGEFYMSKSTSNWSASDWLAQGKGQTIGSRNARCVSIIDNDLENIALGINISVDGLPITDNSVRALIARNTISRFSVDGIRPNGSDITVLDNRIIDSMLGIDDGDTNHDDGMQIFAHNGHVYNNIRIENNWVQETTDRTRPLIGEMQGISNFDGLMQNLTVRNNVVLISAYHGMHFVADGGLVENNTVLYVGDGSRNTWISIDPEGKKGEITKNVTLRNNVARMFIYPSSTGSAVTVRYPNIDVAGNNITVSGNEEDAFSLFNPVGGQFDLRPKSGGPLSGKGAGASGLSSGLGSVAGASTAVPTLDQLMKQLEALFDELRRQQ
ncbi:MAG: peptidoglycan-binding protein [Patescibacteria group bacterium]